MHQLHEDTLEKICYLKDEGFHVVEMWECELKKEMEHDEDLKRYFEEYELVDPLQACDAFYGGRTNAANYCTSVRKARKLGKNHVFIKNPLPNG